MFIINIGEQSIYKFRIRFITGVICIKLRLVRFNFINRFTIIYFWLSSSICIIIRFRIISRCTSSIGIKTNIIYRRSINRLLRSYRLIINIRFLSNNRFSIGICCSISIVCCIIICMSSIICRTSVIGMLSIINRFSISISLFISRSCTSTRVIISSISICRSYSFRRIIISSSIISSIIILIIRILYSNIRSIVILRSFFRSLNSYIRGLSRIIWSNFLIIRRSIYNSRSVISRRFNKNSIMRSCIRIAITSKYIISSRTNSYEMT